MFTPLHPLSSSLVCLTSPFLIYPALFLLLSPCVPAPSLTRGPCVPVCNISKAVRQPGQGKQPSTGFRGDGGRDVFPQEPRDPWRLLAGAREGPRGGRWSPKLPPKRTHTNQFIFFSLPVVIFCLLSLSSSSLCLWFSHSASLRSVLASVYTALQQHLLHTYTAIHHHSYTHFHSQSFPQSIPLLEQRRYAHVCTFKISWIRTVCSTWEKWNQEKNKAFISECKPVKVKQKEYFNLMCFWKYSLNPLCQEYKGETEEEKRRKRIRKDVKRKERDTAKGEKENIEKGWERRKGE